MLTVNSPLRLRNSLVPSSGSTSQNGPSSRSGTWPEATVSSATTGISGVELGEAREDHGLGRLVGGGHRRGVGLGPDRHVAVVVLEDHGAGAIGQRDDLGQETVEIRHHRSAANSRST